MYELDKDSIIRAWDRHSRQRGMRYSMAERSSLQEEEFRTSFRQGVLAHPKLSPTDKKEIIAYAGL